MLKDNDKLVLKLIFILLIIVAIVGVSSFNSVFKKTSYLTEVPDIIPELHPYATNISMQNDDNSEMEIPNQGGGAVVICSSSATVHQSNKIVDFYYKNTSRSKSTVVLQLLINGQVIAQSGAIPPGYQTLVIDLNPDIDLEEGNQNGVLIISFYNIDTRKKESVNSKINIPFRILE